jgi:hypothetical protein
MSHNIADKHAKAADLDAAIKDGARRKADMEGNIDKLLTAMDGLASGMAECQERLAKLEKGGSSGHLPMHGSHHRGVDLVPADGGSPPRGPYSNGPADDSAAVVRSPFSTGDDHGKPREPGEPRPTVADSADPNDAIFGRGGKFQPMFYNYQDQADQACRAWGAAARPPLHGEQLLDYRRRLLRPLMKYSKEFATVDVDTLVEPLIGPIEKSVFSDAIRASTDNSSVPADYLREVVTTDSTGRRISTFYGSPKTWMNQFAGQRRRLVGIRTTSAP